MNEDQRILSMLNGMLKRTAFLTYADVLQHCSLTERDRQRIQDTMAMLAKEPSTNIHSLHLEQMDHCA